MRSRKYLAVFSFRPLNLCFIVCMHMYIDTESQVTGKQATKDKRHSFQIYGLNNSVFFFILSCAHFGNTYTILSCIFWFSSHEHYTVTKGKVLNTIKKQKVPYHQYSIISTCNIISNILTLFRQISITVDHGKYYPYFQSLVLSG